MSATALRIPLILLMGICALVLKPPAFGQAGTLPSDSAPEDSDADGLSTDDWAGIRAAYESERHAAHAVEGGYRAHNPGQAWRTHFDGRGFRTQPIAGGWTWGLELERYGFAGSE